MEIQHIAMSAYDNVGVAEFYKQAFGMVEVHRTYHRGNPGGVYLSDGRINLAILLPREGRPAPAMEGIAHFGFKVDESQVDQIREAALRFGGRVDRDHRPKGDVFVESQVFDPLGTAIDIAVAGWRVTPATSAEAEQARRKAHDAQVAQQAQDRAK